MSTGSQGDAANLKKHEESPTATHSEVIRITSPIDENAGSSQIGADLNTLIPASKAHALLIDNTEGNDEEIETIIEKKLPNDKEKGLDIDSELDFELKWDDDTDLNEDQIDNAYKEIESTLTSIDESLDSVSKSAEIIPTSIETDHGHAEKEIPSPLTSIDEGLDSVSTNPTSTSIEKDPDNEEEEMESTLTSADEGLDSVSKDTEPISIEGHAEKEIKSPLTSIDECLDKVSKIIDPTSTSIEKDIDNEEEEIESTLTSIDEGPDSVSKNTEPISIKKNIDNKEKEMGSTLTFIDEGLDSVSKDTEPISIEGQAEKEIKSPLTSIHKGLDKVIKITDPTSTSIEKDIDNEEKEIESTLTSIDECLRSASLDTKTNLTVEKDLNNAGKEEECLDSMSKEIDPAIKCTDKNSEKEIAITISSQEKQLDSTELKKETNLKSAENDNDLEIFRCNINDNIDTNPVIDTNSMDVDNVDGESASKSVDDVLMQSEELSKTDFVAGNENETFNADTCVKMDLETKISPTASETNSLDEQLVYSDAEVPDIEDKDLLDEIDAQITETEKSIDELGIIDTENLQTPQEPSQSSKENEVYQKNIPCEVDDNPKEEINKTDLNLTCSSEMETSKYDINNEHKLDRPDVMIEIPTQEFIESFDDSGEISDGDEDGQDYEFHNDDINKPDAIGNAASVELNANLIVSHTAEDKTDIVQSVSDKGDVPKDASNTLLKDQVEIDVDTKKSADDVAAIDQVKIAVDTKKSADDVVKIDQVEITVDTKKSADDIAEIENMNIDTSATFEETNKLDDESISASNSNLETQLQPNEENVPAIEEKPSQADIILEANSEQQSELTAEKVNPTPELQTEANKEVKESLENQDLKELEESKATDIDPQPSTSKDHQEMSDEGQPSTSKDHQELSDEDQEVTDSLGLLAESSRVMDDEDEQEQEAEEDDDDDDFDQDDESNQMTAEHSEDSNAQHSETDVPKESMEVDESNDAAEPQIDVAEAQDMETDDHEDDHEAYEDAIDESSADKDFQIQIDEVVSEKLEVETEVEESMEATAETQNSMETQKAVEALLEDESPEETSDEPEAVPSVEETVKVSDSDSDSAVKETSKLRTLLLKASSDSSNEPPETEKKSPIKTRKLEISTPKHEINIVELEESSSEDDVQVCKQDQVEPVPSPKEVTSVPPNDVQVTATSVGETTDTQLKENVAISGLPKPDTQKLTKLNTEELTKTASPASESLAMPETTAPKTPEAKTPIDLGLEIFSLDSDDEDTEVKNKRRKKLTAVEIDKARETNKCINIHCTSDASVPLVPASISAAIYYAANQQRGTGLCLNCAQRMEERSQKLIEGVKDLTPFLNMDMCMIREELVEISDSDSEEDAIVKKDDQVIGEKGANFLEEQLADMFNETWKKYDMESRLLTAQNEISVEVRQLEEECKKIDAMLHECQTETDKLRNDLYDTFADERRELPSIAIFDTPTYQWSGMEEAIPVPVIKESRMPKRRLPPPPEPPAKRPPIPLGYAPLDSDANKPPPETKPTPAPPAEVPAPPEDDNADISVVKLSVESAPAGLPPPGVATRPPLRPNMSVYAMRNTFGAWHKVKIVEVQPKIAGQFTMCRVKFENPKNMSKVLPARCLAYEHPPDVRLTIGTRVVALFKDHRNIEDLERKEAYYSGIVAEIPNPVNNFRYLIFFDDGYAQYVQHAVTRLVCECAPRVWDEVHPFSRQFVRDYLRAYPERPMVRLHAGQSIKTEWNGKWWPSKVIQVDASLVHVFFEGKKEAGIDKTEWIYRGSTRLAPLYLELQAAERQRSRPLPRAQAGRRFNMPYVEYTRSDEVTDGARAALPEPATTARPPAQPHSFAQSQAQLEQEIRRQRAVAKKSTAVAPPPPPARDNVTSRVVYYSPKNAIKPHKWVPHACGPRCKRTDVLALKDLRTYNPLTKPLLSGWERHTLRFRAPVSKTAMYRAPCGRRIRNHKELHQYLQAIESDMSVDLFDFNGHTHCLAEFVLNKCIVSKKDLSHGKENVPVPCVNYYDDSLPEFCSYNTERTPTAGVPLNLDPEFLCGCDCTDDCADKTKCACWKMTLEGARTIGLDTDEVGYVYKRLPEPLPSGIYECNSRCKCRQTCLNRVAQHPLQLKLQVFKTANRGWGIRALNDVPKGAFLCVYAGNLLTDATANLDGLNEGDEYLAELDYIEVVEQMKEGFEEDIPEDAKKLDQEEDSQSSLSPSSDEEPARDADDDFRPAVSAGQYARSEYSKRLRKREKSKKAKDKEEKEKKAKADREKNSEDCITISDDEELREPARFAARAGMGGKEFISKYKSVRAHFGKDEACYIMDAKVQGNIGRYLNHSCTPNVFVQNVFVDTHDPRFPWVAFFALSHIKAGTELTWNYNYDVGSVPGKVLYCYCNAPNCRGRLL